ncbi:collagen alpha-5(VI) chain-like isoform X2 [Vombatus ursinus]|uniref:collagen alpha-5(VI) chain-like isoform X2 n=1 Tax=Vombatus ursinus TaxID=29139 RepID=UPI000FFD27CF|nr:collagen alpha-5(VI) chain-like isoform X2 [Vombatus ursinus]
MKMLLISLTLIIWARTSADQSPGPEFADVVFLVDSSDHLGSKSFPFVRTFISKVINSLPVETNKFRLALAQYSDDLHQEFLLNTFKTKKAMLDHLKKNVDYIGGSLRIGNALEKVHKTYFSGPANGRDKKLFPQILVVLASAKSEDDVVGPAEALQRDGVKIIALGMQDASEENLKAMATSQHHYNLRTVRDVGMFSGNMTRIIKETIKQKEGIQDVDEVVCERDSVADIVFLLDESLEVREDLEDLQRFLENITASMDVRAGCTRIGMLRFSDRAEVVTSLEALMSHAEIAQAIGSLSLRDGKAYIGKALKKAREEVFSRSRKAQGVRQIAVLVTHRSSEDEVNEAADNLLLQGVSIFAIGIEGYNITQLEQIVSYPADRFISIQKSYSDLEPYSVTFLNKLQHEIQYRMSVQHEQTERYRTGCIETEKADIYFLIDGSGSVQNYFQEIKNFMIEVTQMFIVAPEKVRFGAVQYSTDSQEEFGIGVHSNQVNLGKAILNIRQMGYTTNTGAALNFMLQVIQGSRRKQPSNIPCHLLVLTDGKSDDEVAEPAKRLREEDVIIHAIGVKGANLHELEDIAGSKDRVKFVHNFDSLKSIKDEIVQSICHERDCKDKKADIMFLVDSSGSMGAATFSKVKDFMKNFVDKSHIGIDQGHVGVIQFSNFTKEEFGLTEYMNKSDIFDAIDRMRPIGSKTYTGKALRFVSDYFEPLKGGRSGVKKFLILITDGKAHDKVEEPALDLRNKGVTILLVAIFRSKSPQLEDITGNANLVYYVESFDNQKLLEDKLVFDICTLDECKQIQKLDIVFVLDDSSSISFHQHQSMINFTMHLVNKADVGRDRVQFGALKYADDPEILFHLNTYSTKEGVIKGLTYSQGGVNTYTAKALKKSHELFTEKNGSRMNRGVKQMLVVITDGESHDSKDLEATAKTLRDKNIIIYGVGVAAASEKELFDITGSKDKYFMVDNFEKLKEIYLPIEKKACDNSLDVCDMKKADVFFLCDGSDLVTELEFGKMVYFLADIIDNLDVSSENTHVGLSQLGTLHQEIIQLNDTLDKNERKAKILATSKRNGSPRLEVALRHMKDTLVSGSRIVAGVPQILFVVLSGQPKGSVAMVNEAVAKLRELGVCIVALGIGNVRNDEFLHITHNPEKIITVSDFDSLKKVDVKKRVVREICRNCQKESCFVDTVIGFDISTHRRGQTLFEGQPHLESYLPGLLQSINSLRGVSCGRKTQVSVAFKVTTDTSFEPRFQIYEETMMETLRQVTVSGPSHLQVTDLESLWSVFNHSENHGKVILIFSDGLQPGANDLWRLEKKSDELREQGLMGLFVVALNTTTHHDDFSTIEFGKGFEYRTHLSIGMRDLSSTLTKYLDNIAERHCCCALCKCSGAPGAPGSPGSRGAKGFWGQKGSQGHRGEDGEPGLRGNSGPEGQRGAPGCQGDRGFKGFRGINGFEGEEGDYGIDGINGEEGFHGTPGKKGEKGDPGSQGRLGTRGPPGVHGGKGFPGDPGEPGNDNFSRGPKGAKGEQGRQGQRGQKGTDGEPNSRGDMGPPGRRGTHGPKGLGGNVGPKGENGPEGLRGTEGQSGNIGQKGEKGSPGNKGPQGSSGPAGSKGSPGKPGTLGRKGEPGVPGGKGTMGQTGSRGMQGDLGIPGYGRQGRKGAKGPRGQLGDSGNQGDVGDPGIQGKPGPKGFRGLTFGLGPKGEIGFPGAPGPAGPRGPKGMKGQPLSSECELVNFLRDHSPCWEGKCPVYPTELVFALDVSRQRFEVVKNMTISIVKDLKIRENNCPMGAKVAVLSYSSDSRYLVRWSDYSSKRQLLQKLSRMTFQQPSYSRDLGNAMIFVARNVFKRTLPGPNVRRLTVFFSDNQSPDMSSIITATMEFSGLNIIPAVFAFNEMFALEEAFQFDDTGTYQVIPVLPSQFSEPIERLRQCTLCYDKCFPNVCAEEQVDRIHSYMDALFLLDSSRHVTGDEFEQMKSFLSLVLDSFDISKDPFQSNVGDRLALLSYSPGDFSRRKISAPVKEEFVFTTYNSKTLMKRYIQDSLKQLHGEAFVGHALQWTTERVFSNTEQSRKNKVIFVISAGENNEKKDVLRKMALRAKCQGYVIFVISLGSTREEEVEDIASLPLDHHLIQLGRIHKPNLDYAVRFIKPFVYSVRRGFNKYPPTTMERQCKLILSEPLFFLNRNNIFISDIYDISSGENVLLNEEARNPEHSPVFLEDNQSEEMVYLPNQMLMPEELIVKYPKTVGTEEMTTLTSENPYLIGGKPMDMEMVDLDLKPVSAYLPVGDDNLGGKEESGSALESGTLSLEDVFMDVAFLLDSSWNVGSSEFQEIKELISSVLDYLYITPDPVTSRVGDRVALLSYSPQGYMPNAEECPVYMEFDLVTYNSVYQMKSHVWESLQPLNGESFVGHALKWTIDNIFSETPNLRKNRVIFVISAGETNYLDRKALKEEALRAKCLGYAIFVLSFGPTHNDKELEELASPPLDHHLVQLGRSHKPDFDYIVRFIKPFLHSVRRAINQYPPADYALKCINVTSSSPKKLQEEHTIFLPFKRYEMEAENSDFSDEYDSEEHLVILEGNHSVNSEHIFDLIHKLHRLFSTGEVAMNDQEAPCSTENTTFIEDEQKTNKDDEDIKNKI